MNEIDRVLKIFADPRPPKRIVTFVIHPIHAGRYKIELSRDTGTRWIWYKPMRGPWKVIGRIISSVAQPVLEKITYTVELVPDPPDPPPTRKIREPLI